MRYQQRTRSNVTRPVPGTIAASRPPRSPATGSIQAKTNLGEQTWGNHQSTSSAVPQRFHRQGPYPSPSARILTLVADNVVPAEGPGRAPHRG